MKTLSTVMMSLAIVLAACATPDPEHDGFLLVDEDARSAGISVSVSGRSHDGVSPVAVPEGARAEVLRPDESPETVIVQPGELVQVRGAEGALVRGDAPRDSLLVSGEEAAVTAMAEMIGARVSRAPDGGFLIEGPDAFLLAALVGAQPGVRGMGVPVGPAHEPSDVLDVSFELREAPTDPAAPAPTGPIPDAAALVGLYHHGGVSLLLDAAGGYTLMAQGEVVRRGVFRPRPGGVDFVPDDGGEVATMDLSGEQLVDPVGIEFQP